MIKFLQELKALYGDKAKFVFYASEEEQIPFNPLTIGDYIKYTSDKLTQTHILEEEIFNKCVTDPFLKAEIDNLDAGLIPATTKCVLANSAPSSPEEMTNILNYFRNSIITNFLQQLVIFIIRAFPSYKPEDIYAMDMETFMERVALAEFKLMSTGMIQEPLSFYNTDEEPQVEKPKVVNKDLNPPQNLKENWEQQSNIPQPVSSPQTPLKNTNVKKDFVVTKNDSLEWEMAQTGNEILERDLQDKEVRETAELFYQDYLDKMNKNGKIETADIKTPEQRKIEAEERMVENRKEYAQLMARIRKEEAQKNRKTQELFESGLSNKQRKKLKSTS